jgi:threonyl-tRNA synthetase
MKKRDHRIIGIQQELWFNHPYSPGMIVKKIILKKLKKKKKFLLPNGNRIFLKLQELIRGEYKKRGFQEVQTPNLFNSELFLISGHMQNYKEDMFFINTDNQGIKKNNFYKEHALKPMNWPSHCLIYQFRNRSYKGNLFIYLKKKLKIELPIRIADFGVLHRNELKGSLSGFFYFF